MPMLAVFDPNVILAVVVFLVMISVLVAAHEYGHFVAARLFGMSVEEFAIGFGKKPIWAHRPWQKGPANLDEEIRQDLRPGIPPRAPGQSETVYTVRPILLGGYVRVKGMVPEQDGSEISVPGGFYSKPAWQRFLVLFAGPVFSILFGSLVLLGVTLGWGVPKPSNEPVLGLVVEGSPAAKAGLKANDRIVALDGRRVETFYEVLSTVRDGQGAPLRITFDRAGAVQTVVATPELMKEPTPVMGPDLELTPEKRVQAKLGVLYEVKNTRVPFGEALRQAVTTPVEMAVGLVSMFARPSELKDNVGGPGTIAAATGEATKRGLDVVLRFSALLSLSLGFMNLLPIPPFDGGQMVIAFTEMLRRNRRLSFKVQNLVYGLGFALVGLLIVSVVWVDVERLVLKPRADAAQRANAPPAEPAR
ncbi:MAG: site-2 protease family protein [Fimbriimonadaceae bacterium]|nr:site-2 protease family protein [Fimbriimonadaceae bacterium]